MLGWRLPAATDPSNDVADIVGSVLYNGQAGLIDLDLNQQQKVLSAYAYASAQPDYGTFLMAGSPKAGQSLDEVRDLLLAEAAKIRAGEFDEKLDQGFDQQLQDAADERVRQIRPARMFYVYSFIYGKGVGRRHPPTGTHGKDHQAGCGGLGQQIPRSRKLRHRLQTRRQGPR